MKFSPFAMALAGVVLLGMNAHAAPAGKAGKGKAVQPAPKAGAAKPAAKPAKKNAPKAAEARPAGAAMPWTLRPHFSIVRGDTTLYYGEDNAELEVAIAGHGSPMAGAGFAVLLADGTRLTAAGMRKTTSGYEAYTGPEGKGTRYSVTFAAPNGLEVRHEVISPKESPAYLIRLSLKNNGAAPAGVAGLIPVTLGRGALAGIGGGEATLRRMDARAGFVYLAPEDHTTLAMFRPASGAYALSLGMLPSGAADARAALRKDGNAWSGELSCAYAPPAAIKPGESLVSDTAWLMPSMADLQQVQTYYGYAMTKIPGAKQTWDTPRAWVALSSAKGYRTAMAEAKAAQAAGVPAVLFGPAWEQAPGSLEGGAEGFPRDMGKAAQEAKGMDLKAGIAFDPIAVNVKEQPGVVYRGEKGAWVNPFSTPGHTEIAKRVLKLKSWGFDFAACIPSAIPDEALQSFGISRTQADREALMIASAVPGAPLIVPGAMATANLSIENWLEASCAASPLMEQAIMPAPMRVDVAGLGDASPPVMAAICLWPGAIEFAGVSKPEAHGKLAAVAASRVLQAKPIDAGSASPRLWRIRTASTGDGLAGASVMAFPGAPSWRLASLNLDPKNQFAIWRAADGETLGNGDVPAGDALAFYGVTQVNGHPTFMGTNYGPALGLDRIKSVEWSERDGRLSALWNGAEGPGRAYVHVPNPWECTAARVGNDKVETRKETNRLSFDLGAGATGFELRFKRR